jgi:hypothetical protein
MSFFRSRFQDPNQVAMLVQAGLTRANTAGMFIWEDGGVHPGRTYLEFPFSSAELHKQGLVVAAPAPPAEERPVRPVIEAEQEVEPEAPPASITAADDAARHPHVVSLPPRREGPQPVLSAVPVRLAQPIPVPAAEIPASAPAEVAPANAMGLTPAVAAPASVPAPAAAPILPTPAPVTGLRARVGRSSVKTQLRAGPRRSPAGPAQTRGPIPT